MSFITLLQTNPVFFISLCTTIGLVAGSFLNMIIFRLPKMMEREWNQQCSELRGETIKPLPALSLVKPRSECPHCEHKITALESIPIISYLALRGRCSQCNISISLRYPIMEALTGIISGFIAWHFGYGFITVAAFIFAWSMIALAFIDLDTQLLPDDITLPLLWTGLLINLGNGFTDISSAVIGAALGYLFLWLIYWCFKIATGKEGMGYGDFKLLAVIGAWFGWKMLPLVILFSSLVGAVIGVGLIIVAKHKRDTPIPFGPYLVGGGLIALFWGDQLNRIYLDLL
jgi:leader peptidase (prepilin peptidase)/N-methyltransferase